MSRPCESWHYLRDGMAKWFFARGLDMTWPKLKAWTSNPEISS